MSANAIDEVQTMDDAVTEARAILHRLDVAVVEIEGVARCLKRPSFMSRLCESVRDAVQCVHKPFLTPAEAAAECGDSSAFVAARATEGIIKRFGGPGNPKYSRAEIRAAIQENRWFNGGGKIKPGGGV